MPVYLMCSWCHNISGGIYCPWCGHEVAVARMDCACPRCRPLSREGRESLAKEPAVLDDPTLAQGDDR